MPNDVELIVGSDPDLYSTFQAPNGIVNWNDDQWYTLNHEPAWGTSQGDREDWAHPGAQYP